MSNVAEILKTWADYFHVESILSTVLRSLGWGIVKLLATVASAVEGIATSIYGILPTLLSESGFEKIIADFRPLLIVILGLAITFLGYLFIFKRPDSISGHQVFQNFMMIFLTLTVMPLMAGQVATFTTSAADEIFHTFEKDGIAVYQVVDHNLIDMRLLLEEGKLSASEAQRNALMKEPAECNVLSAGKEAISYVQINEVLDYDNDDYPSDQEELISQKISVNTNGILTTVKMNRGFFDIGHEYYYRYHVNWGTLILTLALVAVTYVLAALKLSMIVWEVFLDMILSPFIAVTDLAGGQRIKAFLRNLLSLLAVICVISLLLGGYGLGLKLLSSLEAGGSLGSGGAGTAIYLLLLAGLSWVVIFGPNIVETIFGVDAGLKNSYGVYRAIKDAASAPGRITKKAADTVKNGAKLLSGGGLREKDTEKPGLSGKEKSKKGEKIPESMKSASMPGGSEQNKTAGNRMRVQSEGSRHEKVDSRSRESASQSSDQTVKSSYDSKDRHTMAGNVSSKNTKSQIESKNSKAPSQEAKRSSTGAERGNRISDRGRTSSILQRRETGNSMNVRSPQGGRLVSNRKESDPGKTSSMLQRGGSGNSMNVKSPQVGQAASDRREPISTGAVQTGAQSRSQIKNLRNEDGKPHADAVLRKSDIQRTVPPASENSNRILKNIRAEQSNNAVRTTVLNPDAQNFGKRRPKRK